MCPDNVTLYIEYVALKIQIHWFLRYWRNFTEPKTDHKPMLFITDLVEEVMINPLII